MTGLFLMLVGAILAIGAIEATKARAVGPCLVLAIAATAVFFAGYQLL